VSPVPDPIPRTVEWRDGAVRLIDQRLLPGELCFLDCRTVDEVCEAISSLAIRGAPALGAAGGYGVALACTLAAAQGAPGADIARIAAEAAGRLVATRPTAVNLAWGAHRVVAAAEAGAQAALDEAERLADEDVADNRALGRHGAALVPDGARVLTHCNAGALACVGYGTALGVIRAAAEGGKQPRVWVDETRPVLQGARLTAWELDRLGIPATLVADVMAGSLMASGDVDVIVVGADRVAANGDVANKIGTYSLAVLAAHHGVPFYVAAPTSTIDLATPDGAAIPVEERSPDEVRRVGGATLAPPGVPALNRAFDVTPAGLVTAIVTELGVALPPFDKSLRRLVEAAPHRRPLGTVRES
jgi:methylthioribose-1-phosphate isomerase